MLSNSYFYSNNCKALSSESECSVPVQTPRGMDEKMNVGAVTVAAVCIAVTCS